MIAGIDFSTKAVEIVLLDDDTDEARWFHYDFVAGTPFEKARQVRDLLPGGWFWDDVWLVGIEHAVSMRMPSVSALRCIQGAIAARVPSRIAMFETRANEWQRIFLNLGAKETLPRKSVDRKPLIKARAVELGFGDAPDLPQDAYDSFGIAWACRKLNALAVEQSEAAVSDTPIPD